MVTYRSKTALFLVHSDHVVVLDQDLVQTGRVVVTSVLLPVLSSCVLGLAVIVQSKNRVVQVSARAEVLHVVSLHQEGVYPGYLQQPLLDKLLLVGGSPFAMGTLHYNLFQPVLQGYLDWSDSLDTQVISQICLFYLDSQFSKQFFRQLLDSKLLKLAEHLCSQDSNVQVDKHMRLQCLVRAGEYARIQEMAQ